MRVVLVDPSRTVLKFVSQLLQARGDDVVPFTDAALAFAHIKQDRSVGAMITSAQPLSMTGLELCWETRLLANSERSIYVILMSSNQDRGHLVEALDAGADDFIGKPPAVEELYARLRAAERLARMQRELRQLAATDSLTGALNRRAFFSKAQELRAEIGDDGHLCAIMFDLDYFKRVNDSHGHDAGDKVICAAVRIATAAVPLVARIGGEEFVMLVAGRPLAEAGQIADRVRADMEAACVQVTSGFVQFTGSFGVCAWAAGETIDQFLKRADLALYAAKKAGRNRVVVADHLASSAPALSAGSSQMRTVSRDNMAPDITPPFSVRRHSRPLSAAE